MKYRWLGQKPLHRYRNVPSLDGRGIARIDRTDIGRGSVFEPTEQEIQEFGDQMEPVGIDLVEDAVRAERQREADEQATDARFVMRQRSQGWFDVVDRHESDTPLNDMALRHADAKAFIATLTEQEQAVETDAPAQ